MSQKIARKNKADRTCFNWLLGSAWEPMSRGSASAQTMEAEPPDLRYQAEPGKEYNHLGLLYIFDRGLESNRLSHK